MSFDNFKDISISENFLEKYFEPLQKSYKELCDKKRNENINRGSRLFDLRFRLNMDLNVTINTQYSSTKNTYVKNNSCGFPIPVGANNNFAHIKNTTNYNHRKFF